MLIGFIYIKDDVPGKLKVTSCDWLRMFYEDPIKLLLPLLLHRPSIVMDGGGEERPSIHVL